MSVIDDPLNLYKLRMGLRAHLVAEAPTASDLKALGRLYGENLPIDPPAEQAGYFIRETMLPGTERQVAFKLVESTGIYQLDVIVRRDSSVETAESMRQEIVTAFKPGARLNFVPASIGSYIHIDRVERLGVANFDYFGDEAWLVYGVSITWRAYAS